MVSTRTLNFHPMATLIERDNLPNLYHLVRMQGYQVERLYNRSPLVTEQPAAFVERLRCVNMVLLNQLSMDVPLVYEQAYGDYPLYYSYVSK